MKQQYRKRAGMRGGKSAISVSRSPSSLEDAASIALRLFKK